MDQEILYIPKTLLLSSRYRDLGSTAILLYSILFNDYSTKERFEITEIVSNELQQLLNVNNKAYQQAIQALKRYFLLVELRGEQSTIYYLNDPDTDYKEKLEWCLM